MSDALIRQLLEQRLFAWADQQDLPVAAENAKFSPPADRAYLRFFLLPGRTTSQTIGGDHTSYVGVAQIDICDLAGGGSAEALRIAGLLRTLFPTNLVLTSGTFSVQQVGPLSIAQGFVSDGRWVVPCSFNYRADTT